MRNILKHNKIEAKHIINKGYSFKVSIASCDRRLRSRANKRFARSYSIIRNFSLQNKQLVQKNYFYEDLFSVDTKSENPARMLTSKNTMLQR